MAVEYAWNPTSLAWEFVGGSHTHSGLLTWVPYTTAGQSFPINSLTRDGDWTMIATAATTDRPGPQPAGDAWYSYQGTGPVSSTTAKLIILGNRYTDFTAGEVLGWRVYTKTGLTYRMYVVLDPTGAAVRSQTYTINATTDGWKVLGIPGIVIPSGTTVDIICQIQESDPVLTEWSANWNYKVVNPTTVPAAGEIQHNSNSPSIFRISKTDNGGTSRATALSALLVGDRIVGGGITWTIEGILDQTAYYQFTVAPSERTSSGVQPFTFQAITAGPIEYVVDPAYWPGSGHPTTQGLFTSTAALADLAANSNAYGIDINFQPLTLSTAWSIVARSGGGGGSSTDSSSGGSGGGGGGVTDHNDLTGRTALDSHPISAITGLQTILDNKASTAVTNAGPHYLVWGGSSWTYRGTVTSTRPSIGTFPTSWVVWVTVSDDTYDSPPPLAVLYDEWEPHKDVVLG